MQTLASTPVAEGLFQAADDGPHLIGTRCASCGSHYFPKSLSCRNPQCRDKQVADVLLSRKGILYSYTVQTYQPPALFRIDDWKPYAIGMVELPEGLRVIGMLTGIANADIHIGMAVEMVLEPLYRDEQGQAVLTYKFKPAAAAGGAR